MKRGSFDRDYFSEMNCKPQGFNILGTPSAEHRRVKGHMLYGAPPQRAAQRAAFGYSPVISDGSTVSSPTLFNYL